MGNGTFTRDAFVAANAAHVTPGQAATARGEERVRTTGKLDPLVDPAEFGVVRESRIRLAPRKGGGFEVTVGTPVPIEYRLDTTGSMGRNVDVALAALPQTCGLVAEVLPGRDPFYCASIFGDLEDRGGDGFPLCRGQYEVEAEKMVNQLTLMHPERDGCGNGGEDPHYGLFGGAYLTKTYLERIGLRGYDFTLTDEPMHTGFRETQLTRIFGDKVFEKARVNGHPIDPNELPSNEQVVQDLLKRAHAFVLLVRGQYHHMLRGHWAQAYGNERVIELPDIEFAPHAMAVIIGLTEGTLSVRSAISFLMKHDLEQNEARSLIDAVAHIPLRAQADLPNFKKMPVKGDVFKDKGDTWPTNPGDLPKRDAEETPAPDDSSGKKKVWL